MNSIELRLALTQAFDEARNYIRSQGVGGSINFSVWNYQYNSEKEGVEFQISDTTLSGENRVRGRLLSDVVDEFVRRHNFAQAQANLQIGPPTIEPETSNVTSLYPRPEDDAEFETDNDH